MRRATPLLRHAHRHLTTNAKIPTVPTLLRERLEAASSPTIPPPPHLTVKRRRPSRVTDLYNSLVYEADSKTVSDIWRSVMAISPNGERAPDDLSDAFRERLEACRQCSHGEAAIEVLCDIERRGLLPTARAVVIAVEACLPAEDFELAESALARLAALPASHPVNNSRLVVSARALVAMAYAGQDRFEDALRMMRLPEPGCMTWRDKVRVATMLDSVALGKDTVAWGVVVKSLTKLQMADAAVDVMDYAMVKGVGMTDSLLHLTIDALRTGKRWREADWLFKTAVEKGVVPSERTIGSMMLALCDRDAKRTVSVGKVEELVDMVGKPSLRFMSTALLVLANFGALWRAEEIFAKIREASNKNVPDEYAFAWMMSAYGTYLDVGWEATGEDKEPVKRYEEVNGKADELWQAYLAAYGRRRPIGKMKNLRLGLLTKYLGAKTRCFKISEAVDVLQDIAADGERFPWFDLNQVHFTAVLGAVELSCDYVQLQRVLDVMKDTRTKHDMRSLAFSVGTYLGDGNVAAALALVRVEGPRLLAEDYFDVHFKSYHFAMLQRRLEMLSAALTEGAGTVKDLEHLIKVLKERRAAVKGI